MMLFNLSVKNIKKSIKDYSIYFFTLVLGVAIFYVFNSIDDQTAVLEMNSGKKEIVHLMTSLLTGISVFVAMILGFLIIYASRFLIKRRNKEFGIYLTLGMSKRKISTLLFFETLIIGIVSLAVGLLAGTVLSQFMSVLVANMFEADMTKFQFIFSKNACIKSALCFGIMYLIVMVFNTINVNKCRLIELLQTSKMSEEVKMKNPVLCTLIFAVSSAVLGFVYYKSWADSQELLQDANLLIFLAIASVATFFLFWSVSGLLINIFRSLKNVYFKDLNSFTLRQFSSKINTMVFSMTAICIMLFITITLLSCALGMKNTLNSGVTKIKNADLQMNLILNNNINAGDENNYEKTGIKTIKDLLKENNFNMDEKFKDYEEIYCYNDENLTMRKTLGKYSDEVAEKYTSLALDTPETIMKLSDYNKAAAMYGNEQQTLNDNEYLITADSEAILDLRNKALEDNTEIEINGKKYMPKYKECQYGFLELSTLSMNIGIVIVPDDAVNENMTVNTSYAYAKYNAVSEEEKEKINSEIMEISSRCQQKVTAEKMPVEQYLIVTTQADAYDSSVGLGAIVTFIGLYLGVIFLIASAAILALKEISESTDNKERFAMIRKIGADEKIINKALFRQVGIFFITPLLIAAVHSVFGIKFGTEMLKMFGNVNILGSVALTAVFIILIYGGYFLLTYFFSKNIIKEK